ncbi:dolichyl-phosphate beta-D-mannosyltransferase [Capnocytophaga canimorsus]|uniref:Dolichyl-phosphate beta-D-mannosyltransferase n=1 Tax=Capnocytophaga canimorsus TaxID=28188 RepID=A0A250G7E1_9FLAO|nr:polyprenol monophosphomannose synthase [Capnocytophaga canimorsus]ATA92248.1 dolichyl-phosphate beta-D-mannosyltransferase [Capnocytophaga canimorsus]
MSEHKNLVIIPTYNEIENIEAIIRAVFELPVSFDVLVVDDNSPDGTALCVQNLQRLFPERLFLEVRTGKSGLGTAYVHGFKWALSRTYDYIFEMDADFSHNPADLCRLYEACAKCGYDMAIGSRYVKGVNVVNWPLQRVLLSYGASLYVKVITGMTINDPTAGFVCYSRKVIEVIDLDKIQFVGYAFQIEMKYKAYLKKYKIVEIPIIFTDRVNGESKINKGVVKEAIFGVFSMRLKHLFKKYKTSRKYEYISDSQCENS